MPLVYTKLTSVYATTTFAQLHQWPDAPERRAYLRNLHRHLFNVKVEVRTGPDRDIEFHDLKDMTDRLIDTTLRRLWSPSWSCEVIAEQIILGLMDVWPERTHYAVTVSEDGENGATVSQSVGEVR